jgi:hypothetical protein
MDPFKKFYHVYNNSFNYFAYERVYQGHSYTPKPNSQLLCLHKNVPQFFERPILYFLYLPKYF